MESFAFRLKCFEESLKSFVSPPINCDYTFKEHVIDRNIDLGAIVPKVSPGAIDSLEYFDIPGSFLFVTKCRVIESLIASWKCNRS